MFVLRRRQLRRGVESTAFAAVFVLFAQTMAFAQGVPAAAPVTSGATPGQTQSVPQAANTPQNPAPAQPEITVAPLTASLNRYTGQTVSAIQYVGVDFDKTDKLTSELTQKSGEPFDPAKVRQTTRRLFATGRYLNIGVRVEKTDAGLTLLFTGIPRLYVGKVTITGVKVDRLASLLEYGTKLNPGVAYNDADANAGADSVKQVLSQNGYYEPVISVKTERDDAGQQMNVTYTVDVGPAGSCR